MKRYYVTVTLRVLLFGASTLLAYVAVPIGWNMYWENVARGVLSIVLILVPLILFGYQFTSLVKECLAAGKPINASALEPEILYIVDGVMVRRGGGHASSLAVLRRAVLEGDEVDKLTERLLVFFPDQELKEGGRVMAVTPKWYEAFSKTGATSETTLVLVGSQA